MMKGVRERVRMMKGGAYMIRGRGGEEKRREGKWEKENKVAKGRK